MANGAVVFRFYPPLVTVSMTILLGTVGSTIIPEVNMSFCGRGDPFHWHDLLAIPRSVIQMEVTNLGHVAGAQVQVTVTVSDALRVRRPTDIRDSHGAKQVLAGKL